MRLRFEEMFREWNCATCTADLRQFRGHDGPPAQGGYLIQLRDGEPPARFDRCPLLAVTDRTLGWLTVYRDYERGLLPWPGALMDQSTRWYHAMVVLDGAIAQAEKEQIDEANERRGLDGPGAAQGKSSQWDSWAVGK